MGIFNIPKEVIENHVLPYLGLNDILRLRRVSQFGKTVSDHYLSVNGRHLLPKIEVEEGIANDRSLINFMELGFSISSIHLKIKKIQALGNRDVHEFLVKYGTKISDLFIDIFECCGSQEELEFYEALPNLHTVHFQQLNLLKLAGQTFQFPSSFKNIKTLKVYELISPVMCPDDGAKYSYFSKFLTFCNSLEYLAHPRFILYSANSVYMEYRNEEFLDHIRQLIINRGSNHQNEQNLKVYDLEAFKYTEYSEPAPSFLELCRVCSRFGVKLTNVNTNFLFHFDFEPWRRRIMEEVEELITPFQSVINLHWLLFWSAEGKNLEEITINSTAACSIADMPTNGHPKWPLRKLALIIDSDQLEAPDGSEMPTVQENTDILLGFLFREDGWPHEKLEELRLEFSRSLKGESVHLQKLERKYRYPLPRASSIIAACPNLKKLELKYWPGTNKELVKICKVLTSLEEILFDECEDVGNVTFFGSDISSPVFLQMPRLKKLTLRNLDKMPKITDLVFELVFRHLMVKQFLLHSSTPIKKVTVNGIRALLNGAFANAIERFPFNTWSLDNVKACDFKQLESEFRSAHMV